MSKQLTDEWGTPDKIFDLLPAGAYFDPCPSFGQPLHMLKNYETVTIYRRHPDLGFVDGIKNPFDWQKTNFVNPPFSGIQDWINKAVRMHSQLATKSIVVIPDHTDRIWYRRAIQPTGHPVVWIGRTPFIPLNGQKTSQPHFGTGLMMIGFSDTDVKKIISSVTPSQYRELLRSKPSRAKRGSTVQPARTQPEPIATSLAPQVHAEDLSVRSPEEPCISVTTQA